MSGAMTQNTPQGLDINSCLDEASRSLGVVGRSLCGLLQDLATPPSCLALAEIDRLEQDTGSLRNNLESLLSAMANPVGVTGKSEVEEIRAKSHALEKDNERMRAQVSVLQGELVRLRTQLQNQSAFCATLGAVLGNLVWKASRVPSVVDLLLSGNKVAPFLCIVSGTLESFLETFDTVMPGATADESQFIMAMGGVVTNMAAAPAGRQFLVSDPNGRELILQIIRILPAIPSPSGNCLKRLLLMALYNISINQAGLSLLHDEGKGTIFTVVANCLKAQSTPDLRLMALRLMLSLTCDIDASLLAKVPKDIINDMTNSEDPNVQKYAQEVMENLTRVQDKIQQASGTCKSSPCPTQTPTEDDDFSSEKQQTAYPTTAWRLRYTPNGNINEIQ